MNSSWSASKVDARGGAGKGGAYRIRTGTSRNYGTAANVYQLCEDKYGRIFQNTIARHCFPITSNCEIFSAHFSILVDTRAYIENRNKKTILKNSTFLSILKHPLVSTAISAPIKSIRRFAIILIPNWPTTFLPATSTPLPRSLPHHSTILSVIHYYRGVFRVKRQGRVVDDILYTERMATTAFFGRSPRNFSSTALN